MIGYRDLIHALDDLGLTSTSRVIMHSSREVLDSFQGGSETLIGALMTNIELLITPAFTPQTMVIPPTGPQENAIEYGSEQAANLEAEFFHADLPADPKFGSLPRVVMDHEAGGRTNHPVLSFAGVHSEEVFNKQTLDEPFGPIEWLAEFDGDVLLVGVDHRSNSSSQYAEQLAGRKRFIRWALMPDGVQVCENMPGCSDGFEAIRPRLDGILSVTDLDSIRLELIPVRDLVHLVAAWIREDPRALLCGRSDCQYCPEIRAEIRTAGLG
jgi:aminoglycoside 3-N-acetyltransferase